MVRELDLHLGGEQHILGVQRVSNLLRVQKVQTCGHVRHDVQMHTRHDWAVRSLLCSMGTVASVRGVFLEANRVRHVVAADQHDVLVVETLEQRLLGGLGRARDGEGLWVHASKAFVAKARLALAGVDLAHRAGGADPRG